MTKRPRDRKRAVCLAVVFVSLACLLYMELAPAVGLPDIRFSSDETMQRLVYMSLTRLLGAAAFLAVLITLGYRVLNPLKKPLGKALVFCIPAFLVAVNNAPLLGLATGTVYFTHTGWYLFWFIVECVAIGAFEELAFRGTVLLMITEKRRRTTGDLVIAILLSSAVFAVVHMVNLLVGADPGAVFLQIGYSFLIGAMCAVVLFKTANIWLCVLLHAVYDFGGNIAEVAHTAGRWDRFTMILTAVLAVCVIVIMLIGLLRIKPEELGRIYEKKKKLDA